MSSSPLHKQKSVTFEERIQRPLSSFDSSALSGSSVKAEEEESGQKKVDAAVKGLFSTLNSSDPIFRFPGVKEARERLFDNREMFSFQNYAVMWKHSDDLPSYAEEQIFPVYFSKETGVSSASSSSRGYLNPLTLSAKSTPVKNHCASRSPLKLEQTPAEKKRSFGLLCRLKKEFAVSSGRNAALCTFTTGSEDNYTIFACTSGLPGGHHAEMKAFTALPPEILENYQDEDGGRVDPLKLGAVKHVSSLEGSSGVDNVMPGSSNTSGVVLSSREMEAAGVHFRNIQTMIEGNAFSQVDSTGSTTSAANKSSGSTPQLTEEESQLMELSGNDLSFVRGYVSGHSKGYVSGHSKGYVSGHDSGIELGMNLGAVGGRIAGYDAAQHELRGQSSGNTYDASLDPTANTIPAAVLTNSSGASPLNSESLASCSGGKGMSYYEYLLANPAALPKTPGSSQNRSQGVSQDDYEEESASWEQSVSSGGGLKDVSQAKSEGSQGTKRLREEEEEEEEEDGSCSFAARYLTNNPDSYDPLNPLGKKVPVGRITKFVTGRQPCEGTGRCVQGCMCKIASLTDNKVTVSYIAKHPPVDLEERKREESAYRTAQEVIGGVRNGNNKKEWDKKVIEAGLVPKKAKRRKSSKGSIDDKGSSDDGEGSAGLKKVDSSDGEGSDKGSSDKGSVDSSLADDTMHNIAMKVFFGDSLPQDFLRGIKKEEDV
ncbi:hypothetical protein AB751O23_AK_00160 [Chlamydiales bacterium SCGC AB-751-O23]|jgi:hypothetical protein|nr:hypothetical protein AB751O23_AK_00160 [Chlamydiales bacterium SCGC AB-751-O23]